MTIFGPILPGQVHTFQIDKQRPTGKGQDLILLDDRPDTEPPALHELLPNTAEVPTMFEPTEYRRAGNFFSNTEHVELEHIKGARVLATYAPAGELSRPAVHIACRITLLRSEQRTADNLDDAHTEIVWQAHNGDPNREMYSSWATADFGSETKYGRRRTTFRLRRPRIDIEDLRTPVDRPVDESAFVVQSVDWGLVETGAYVTPEPEDGRALELAESVANTVTTRAENHDTPVYREPWKGDDE